jgi:hypothetical protein
MGTGVTQRDSSSSGTQLQTWAPATELNGSVHKTERNSLAMYTAAVSAISVILIPQYCLVLPVVFYGSGTWSTRRTLPQKKGGGICLTVFSK